MLSPTLEVGAFNMRCPTSAADVYPLLYQENLDTYTYFEGFFDGGPFYSGIVPGNPEG